MGRRRSRTWMGKMQQWVSSSRHHRLLVAGFAAAVLLISGMAYVGVGVGDASAHRGGWSHSDGGGPWQRDGWKFWHKHRDHSDDRSDRHHSDESDSSDGGEGSQDQGDSSDSGGSGDSGQGSWGGEGDWAEGSGSSSQEGSDQSGSDQSGTDQTDQTGSDQSGTDQTDQTGSDQSGTDQTDQSGTDQTDQTGSDQSGSGTSPDLVSTPSQQPSQQPAPSNGGSSGGGNEKVITSAYVTAYTFQDNTPAGSPEISHPQIHQQADGTGTWQDPITIAVGHDLSSGSDVLDYPAGTRMYVPNMKRYFIVEDTCGDGPSPQTKGCHDLSTADSGATTWVDMWIGGEGMSKSETDQCAGDVTGIHTIIVNPGSSYPVASGKGVLNNGKCDHGYGESVS